MRAAGPQNSRRDWVIIALVALAGAAISVWLWRSARAAEVAREELAFSRQVETRHALIRQTLDGYEDCLLAMRVYFTYGRDPDQTKFSAVARTQFGRYPGFLGMQWAPRVGAEARAAWEGSNLAVLGATGRIRERAPGGADIVAQARAEYFPILFAEPFDTNRHVIGSDAAASPLRSIFDSAAASQALAMSGLMKLVYESGANDGIVMVCPVASLESGRSQPAGVAGYLLGVFRVADLLGRAWSLAAGSMMDVMFIDESATRADRRVLYCHRDQRRSSPVPTEAEFRRGPHRVAALLVAGRNWTIVYRRADERGSTLGSPLMALVAGLAVTLLGSGLLASHFRRTRTIEREVAERTRELSESRRQLSNLMHALPGLAFRGVYEDTLSLTFVSEGALSLTGYAPEDFLTGRIHWRELMNPEDLARVRTVTRAAMSERREVEVEYRMRTREGGEKWVLSRGRGVFVDGLPPVFEGLAIDITAQKNAEAGRLALERKLLEGQKLESLGLLAGGIAHDFNNLLSTVIGNAELARLAIPAGHGAEGKLRAIEAAAVRASELCRQMLAYAGKGRFVVEPADLSALTEDMVPLLKLSITRQGGVSMDLARGLPAVLVDATQIRQIVMNLVLNAADAIADQGGRIVVKTGVMPVSAEMLAGCRAGADLRPGDFVYLEVRDDGVGMTPDVLARIFDPFFTTKFTGRGLGLAAVLGIVRGHGGALCVTSKSGAGSTFRLLLPPVSGPIPVLRSVASAAASGWNQKGCVLVVDDEAQVRFVMAEMLRSFGFSPVEAGDGNEAVAALRASPAGFDAVVLDLLMPGLNGEQTLTALRALNPGVRVLLMSGYSEEDVMRRVGPAGAVRFLAKPFTRATLERALRELLAAGTSPS